MADQQKDLTDEHMFQFDQPESTKKLGMPPYIAWKLGAATITAMRKVQKEDPEMWARIKARGRELAALNGKQK